MPLALPLHAGGVRVLNVGPSATPLRMVGIAIWRSAWMLLATLVLGTPVQAQAGARLSLAAGVGYGFSVTSLGTFGSARARIGHGPSVQLTAARSMGGRWAINASAIAAIQRSISVEAASSCQGACSPFTFEGRGRFLATGIDIEYRLASGRAPISVLIGPWVRSYASARTVNVCDLDAYCQSASYFIPSDTHGGVRIGLRASPSSALPVTIDIADIVARYRTGTTQHYLNVGVLFYLRR